MSFRSTVLALLIAVLLPVSANADLRVFKPKRAFVVKTVDSETFGEEGANLFSESFDTRGKRACLLVRISSEVIVTDIDDNGISAIEFEILLDGEAVEAHPRLHHTTAQILPSIVSFETFVCDVPAGRHNLTVLGAAAGSEDIASVLTRNLEIWVQKGSVPAAP